MKNNKHNEPERKKPAQRTISVNLLNISNNLPLVLIAGPCQIESAGHAEMIAGKLNEVTSSVGIGFIFKSSFDKANRTSLSGKRGVGFGQGLSILSGIRSSIGCPVLSDVHEPAQCSEAADALDVLQIPAFLCRQTDLLLAAGRSGSAVNVKKGQFLAPWDMNFVVEKIASTGNERIMLCERGASFGYNTLVTDMRSLAIMADTGYPVVIDATHSVQQPGGKCGSSGGQRRFAPLIARAAVSVGVAAVFLETHEDPDRAPSDGPNMVHLDKMAGIVDELAEFDRLAKSKPLLYSGE